MATATHPTAETPSDATGMARLWDRQLHHYPDNRQRYLSLSVVVVTTIVLYYQLYLAGAVATSILANLHMSFVFFVNTAVVGYVLGAVASIVAGAADRYGRANIVTGGLLLTGLLSLFALPNVHSKWSFAVFFILIGFVEGIVLVATPALIRDFSPQLGRASAMGFWTLGPVIGSLVVSIIVTNTTKHFGGVWQDQYIVAGIVGIVVFLFALAALRELSPRLRDQLMVSAHDRVLIEARAAGVDVEEGLKNPFRQMLHLDILGSAFAISVFLLIYYIAVGFFPVFFQTVFGYSQATANGLGNWFWSIDAGALLIVGWLSDKVRVRKPFMVVGAIGAAIATSIFAVKADEASTSHGTFVVLLVLIAVFLGLAFAPWMASFTETVERRNPALTATGLAVWGLTIRVVVALSAFFVPYVVTTVSDLVDSGPVVLASLASTQPVGHTTIGKVLTSLKDNPTVAANLTTITTRDATLLAALEKQPLIAQSLAAAKPGTNPTPAQLHLIKGTLGTAAYDELFTPAGTVNPRTAADLTYLTTVAPAKLGAANFAALNAPTPTLSRDLTQLSTFAAKQKQSANQWKTYFFVGVGGEVVFIPLIFVMAGFWDPRKAKEAEERHEAMIREEIAKLESAPAV